jgi:hypothetical protein
VPDLARAPRSREVGAVEHPGWGVRRLQGTDFGALQLARTSSNVDGGRERLALPDSRGRRPILRSRDLQTMRLCVYPLGVRSTRFAGPACAELPGRDPTLEHRSPEAKGGVLSIEICLSFTSWRALGPCLRVCDSLARPGDVRRSCDATQPRRHVDPHERFQTLRGSPPRLQRSENRRFRSGWPSRVPLPIGTEGHAPSTTSSSRRREGPSGRFCLLESPASTTFASRLNPRRVHYDLGQVR